MYTHTHTVSHSNVSSTNGQLFPSLSALVREESFVTFTTQGLRLLPYVSTYTRKHTWAASLDPFLTLTLDDQYLAHASINSTILCQELYVSLNITQLYQTFQISY